MPSSSPSHRIPESAQRRPPLARPSLAPILLGLLALPGHVAPGAAQPFANEPRGAGSPTAPDTTGRGISLGTFVDFKLLTPVVTEGEPIRLEVRIPLPTSCTAFVADAYSSGAVVGTFAIDGAQPSDFGSVSVQSAMQVDVSGFGSGGGPFVQFVPSNPPGATEIRSVVSIETAVTGGEPRHIALAARTQDGFDVVTCDGGTFTFDVGVGDPTLGPLTATVQPAPVSADYRFFVADAEVTEGDEGVRQMDFVLDVDPPWPGDAPIGLRYGTYDRSPASTAEEGVDYRRAMGEATLYSEDFPYSMTVLVIGDLEVEADETFELHFALDAGRDPPGNVIVANPIARGTIRDDDEDVEPPPAALVVGISAAELAEGNSGTSALSFPVTLSRLLLEGESPVVLEWRTVDDSATVADGDYVEASGSLELVPGGSLQQTVEVTVRGDTEVEPDETFRVVLSRISGDVVLDPPSAVGTIRNDDEADPDPDPGPPPGVRFVSDRFSVRENAGVAVVRVERTGSVAEAMSVMLEVRSGSATADLDFVPQSTPIRWQVEEGGSRVVEIVLIDDSELENDETVRLLLRDPVRAELVEPSSARLRIIDDEEIAEIVFVEGQGQSTVVGQPIAVAVLVRDGEARPVGGVTVDWSVDSPLASLSDEQSTTGQDGIASTTVDPGSSPGALSVTAAVAQAGKQVVLEVTVAGLTPLFEPGSGPHSVAQLIDDACASGSEAFREACEYLYGLGPDDQRRAVEELAPDEVASLGLHGLEAQVVLLRQFADRLRAARRGVRFQTGQIALDLGDRTLRPAMVLADLRHHESPEARLDRAVDSALGRIRGGGSDQPGLRSVALARSGQDTTDATSDGSSSAGERWGFFLSGRLTNGDRSPSEHETAFDFDTGAITVGGDYRLTRSMLVGLGFSYADTTTDFTDGGGYDADGFSFTVYSTWWGRRVWLDFVGTYGESDYAMNRFVDLPQPFLSTDGGLDGRTRFGYRATPGGDQTSLMLGGGYDFVVGAFGLSGLLRASWVDAGVDGFVESGSGPFTLEIFDQDLDSLLAEAGLEAVYAASFGWGVLQPIARLSYLQELEDDVRFIRGRFWVIEDDALEFGLPTEPADQSYFNLGLGLSATLPGGTSFFLNYDTDLDRRDFRIETFAGGLRLAFD